MLSLYEDYVCVRVTDMRGVDLKRYTFDFDLTFGALLMHPSGHVYHRYGGRDHRRVSHWLSSDSFENLLEHTLGDHGARRVAKALEAPEPLRIEELPAFQKRDKGECIHCHSVYPALYEEELAAKTWTAQKKWKHPSPMTIGIDLGREDQRLVISVAPESAAARAGLAVGDRLHRVAGTEVMTASDVMYQLDRLPWEAQQLALLVERSGRLVALDVQLAKDWKRGTPLDFSWRPSKWGLTPAPGFGGSQLSAEELREAGLLKDGENHALPFVLGVTYLVTWGKNQRFGKAARKAGLRKGDLLVGVNGRSDFVNPGHLHAWWRLERKPGDVVRLDVLREGKPLSFDLKVIP